jgi:hypothetical protein
VEWPERAGDYLRHLPTTRILDVDIAITGADTRSIAIEEQQHDRRRARSEGGE